MDKMTIQVPTMGDSITEGTIVEWTAAVGQAVETDDVVALIETDKVTVDIKADRNGVITKQFGAVDDTVEVGSSLYEIDTNAEATVSADAPPAPTPTKEEDAPTEAPAAAAVSVPPTAQLRTPSITFLGKEGWMRRLSAQEAVPDTPISSMYGRPVFSETEMEALILGGANVAPSVVSMSSTTVFEK